MKPYKYSMIVMALTSLVMGCFATGCSSPSEVIISHFRELTGIAQTSQGDCERMGNALVAYITENEDELRSAVSDVSNSEASEAVDLYKTSLELYQATSVCRTPGVDAFRARLSQIVLISTDN